MVNTISRIFIGKLTYRGHVIGVLITVCTVVLDHVLMLIRGDDMLGEFDLIRIVTERRRAECHSVVAGTGADCQAVGDRVFPAVLIAVIMMPFDRACHTDVSADIKEFEAKDKRHL